MISVSAVASVMLFPLPCSGFILDGILSFPAVHCAEYCRYYCPAIIVIYVPIILLLVR